MAQTQVLSSLCIQKRRLTGQRLATVILRTDRTPGKGKENIGLNYVHKTSS